MSAEPWLVELENAADGWTRATIAEPSGLLGVVGGQPYVGEGPTLAKALEALARAVAGYGVDLPGCPHEGGWTTEPADPDEGDMTPVTTCDDCTTRWENR